MKELSNCPHCGASAFMSSGYFGNEDPEDKYGYCIYCSEHADAEFLDHKDECGNIIVISRSAKAAADVWNTQCQLVTNQNTAGH